MALTYPRISNEAQSAQAVCELVRTALLRANDVVRRSQEQAIDWGNAQKPAYIDEDAAGNLSGLPFSRQDVSNAIGTLDHMLTSMTDDHVGNLNKLTRPIV